MSDSRHWNELDGMRGILALGVVFLHFGANSFFIKNGFAGFQLQLSVDVFFLLSGFVLTHSARNGVQFGQFIYRRFWRLAPVFFVTTCLSLAATSTLPHPLEFLGAVPLIGGDPVNGPAWSVAWEFYLPLTAVLLSVRIPQVAVRPLLLMSIVALGTVDIWVED